jgi:PLD-like domain
VSYDGLTGMGQADGVGQILRDAPAGGTWRKVMIIDGETMIGGSFSYTKGAQNQNAENVEITRSQALAAKYTENWQTHARHSEPYVGRGVAR